MAERLSSEPRHRGPVSIGGTLTGSFHSRNATFLNLTTMFPDAAFARIETQAARLRDAIALAIADADLPPRTQARGLAPG